MAYCVSQEAPPHTQNSELNFVCSLYEQRSYMAQWQSELPSQRPLCRVVPGWSLMFHGGTAPVTTTPDLCKMRPGWAGRVVRRNQIIKYSVVVVLRSQSNSKAVGDDSIVTPSHRWFPNCHADRYARTRLYSPLARLVDVSSHHTSTWTLTLLTQSPNGIICNGL